MRALKQRNALLKQKDVSSISCWEEELSRSSAYIVLQRRKAVHFLNDAAKRAFEQFLKSNAHLVLSYQSQCRPLSDMEALRQSILQEYERKRSQELYIGATLVGPHRDDLLITINSQPARDFASIGQSALAATALRLAEWHYLSQETRERPLMIVDDFAHCLDATRKTLLFTELSTLGQLFISSHESLRGFSQGAVKTLQIKNGASYQTAANS
jgi:DNA replication and repair protein RecF